MVGYLMADDTTIVETSTSAITMSATEAPKYIQVTDELMAESVTGHEGPAVDHSRRCCTKGGLMGSGQCERTALYRIRGDADLLLYVDTGGTQGLRYDGDCLMARGHIGEPTALDSHGPIRD
jgi:hypothetical protein